MGRLPTSERPRSLSLGTGAVRFSDSCDVESRQLNAAAMPAAQAASSLFRRMVDKAFRWADGRLFGPRWRRARYFV